MNKNLQSPTKLTEFAPLQSEEKQQGVGQFISKFFKLSRSTPTEPSVLEASEDSSRDISPAREVCSGTKDAIYPVDVTEERSLPNVLKRISNLLALKTNNLQAYSDTELKQYWMPDSVSKECYECSEKFTTFRRRHHCRVCGQIFCSQCCNEQIPGKIFGCTGDLRVCTYCCKVVLTYLQSSDAGTDLTTDLKALQESLMNKYGPSSMSTSVYQDSLSPSISAAENLDSNGSSRRKISVGYQEEKFASSTNVSYLTSEEKCRALQNSSSLRNLFEEMCRTTTGVPLKTQRYRLRSYADSFLGSDLVDWLIYQQRASTRVQASAICQALLEGGYIICLSDPCSFIDGYAVYKLGSLTTPEQVCNFEVVHQDEPSWVQQVPQQELSTTDSDNEQLPYNPHKSHRLAPSSSYTLDLNVEANTVYLSRPCPSDCDADDGITDLDRHKTACKEVPLVRTSEQREFVPESGWHEAAFLREDNGEKVAYDILSEAYKQHEQGLVEQLLSYNGLPSVWADVIVPLVRQIVDVIRPDKGHDAVELDIRQYVQFKKIASGNRSDTKLVEGIICSKNVVHKSMATVLENPRILLLQCSIVYQRTEGRLMSLDPVLMQEQEYLRHVVARIVALQPNIILVQRNVSRLAQDLLRQHAITLVHNVKNTILERISRCTQADIVLSVDSHIGRPRLGKCRKFHLKKLEMENGRLKTLMFFEGLPLAHLGGTVLLRGAPTAELVKVKKVAALCLFACYNWRLEKSFLMDEFAQPPRNEFFEDSKENTPEESSKFETDGFKPANAEIKDKKLSAEPVENFSDPLHNLSEGETVFETQKLAVAELPFSGRFRKALNGTILSVSPYIVFPVPYLETEVGKKCKLRSFFPEEIYYSNQFGNEKKMKCVVEVNENQNLENKIKDQKPPHPFLTTKIHTTMDSNEILTLLAHFRACGSSYPKKPTLVLPQAEKTDKDAHKSHRQSSSDVFDPNNHQKLYVLFCSFSHESNNAPAFCVNPWVVPMDFYGCNDIPLGCFLERYCFRSSYACPSKTCETPMLNHTRRFVHNCGVVSVSLKCLSDELLEENIVMWSFCTKCQTVSPTLPMSADTWSYSFAKYLELMFYGNVYSRRGKVACPHSLHHDLYQYFGYKNYVASFKYSPVQLWEISLPPSVIEIKYETKLLHDHMINEIKMLSLKGHDMYSVVLEKLHSISSEVESVNGLKHLLTKEQAHFKQKIEEAQLQLTSPTLEHKEFEVNNGKVLQLSLWKIEDSIVKIKKLLMETVEQWNARLLELIRKTDKKREKYTQQEIDSPRTSENKSITSEISDCELSQSIENSSSGAFTKKIKSLDHADEQTEVETPPSPKGHQRSQSDGPVMLHNDDSCDSKKDTDKKTVKNLLSQLLPTNTNLLQIPPLFGPQEHFVSPGTFGFVAVYENEPSSIIAYTLNSPDYKKSLDELTGKKNSENAPSPMSKRKSNLERSENGEITSSVEKSTGLLSFLRNKDPKSDSANQAQNATAINECSHNPEQNLDDCKKAKTGHVEVQFQDANCNFFCRVYFAEKFDALRSKMLLVGEEAYIRSLCRSVPWNARGGKSGSTFSKTTDDRFVLKEVSKSELPLFIDWAPNYFSYMERCCSTQQPTLLGKILGLYQIIFKNNTTNVTLRTNLLVMENLFYNRTVVQKFDLKGSVRNRLVNPNDQTGEIVLLDENLLKMTCESPLYVLPHSKVVLMAAIQNDTEFLSAQSVMDYSLLVGLDSENKELVLGIIDYIRTFTWDKKLETMVKKSGILGGQGKLPTIVSPEEYQKRFIEAMHRYFLEVPDHWADLGKGVEC